jgi:hypothetical protein
MDRRATSPSIAFYYPTLAFNYATTPAVTTPGGAALLDLTPPTIVGEDTGTVTLNSIYPSTFAGIQSGEFNRGQRRTFDSAEKPSFLVLRADVGSFKSWNVNRAGQWLTRVVHDPSWPRKD